MSLFGLIDVNNFFVSCERIFRPDLANKPVGVLSNNDGCFVARSNEIKALGGPMGAPLFKYKKLMEDHKVTIFSSNFALYGDISSRFMSFVESLVPRLEVYSIDEAFIDFTGISGVQDLALCIRQQVLKSLGLPTCIGVSKTKTLAKVANLMAKKKPYYNGVCVLENDDDIEEALKWIEIGDLWGVGRRLSPRLQQHGIRTGYDLKQADPRWMRKNFTVIGERLVNELRGIPCLELEEEPQARKSIQVSRTFSEYITEFESLREHVASYATRLGSKMRRYNLKTANLLVYIRTNPHNKMHGFYYESFTIHLPMAVNDDANLIKACGRALEAVYKQGYLYKKAGVVALELMPEGQQQYSLFSADNISTPKTSQASKAIDELNKKYGTGMVHMASCKQRLSWGDRKDQKSPAYTTSWKELPIVYAK